MVDGNYVCQSHALAEEELMKMRESCLQYPIGRETRKIDILLTVKSHKQQNGNPERNGKPFHLFHYEIQNSDIGMPQE